METKLSPPFLFGTKAETLHRISAHLKEARVPELLFFTVKDWHLHGEVLLEDITARFGSRTLAIRSSALSEDSASQSMAGAFCSQLHVPANEKELLFAAITSVIASMKGNERDQVLVQVMCTQVALSGVIMTFDLVHGAPYYGIDFDDESGATDRITSGTGRHKSLFVYRHADMRMLRSARVTRFIRLAQELEAICQCAALDIEFGLTDQGELFLFQVRRISLARHWHPVMARRAERQIAQVARFIENASSPRPGILGARTVFALMPDWNPAEMIGTTPRPLSASLYRFLITQHIWAKARAHMGYRVLENTELMCLINHHPYIDVRHSLNSFLPKDLPDAIGEKLVNAWQERLKQHPEMHDKIEFEIVPTCLDFCFHEDFGSRYPHLLSPLELEDYKKALQKLTRECLRPGAQNTLDQARHLASTLTREHLPKQALTEGYANLMRAHHLLSLCQKGSFAFAIAARHAFMAEALLRSAVRQGALTQARLDALKRSIQTVAGDMVVSFAEVCNDHLSKEAFLHCYGHLRPGTYDILSLRYDERDDLFMHTMPSQVSEKKPFVLSSKEAAQLQSLLTSCQLELTPEDFLAYARKAIAGREELKFIFTRLLSDALSEIVKWGATYGISRDDLSYLTWPTLADALCQPVMDDMDRYYLARAEEARQSMSAAHALRFGHMVFGVEDLYVATLNRSEPNFVGTKSVSGQIVVLKANSSSHTDLTHKIVCIENADPGFDWIFTRAPAALITCFGGANSHMAVRCAEFSLPAAIGCGEQRYLRLVASGYVELRCADKSVRSLNES